VCSLQNTSRRQWRSAKPLKQGCPEKSKGEAWMHSTLLISMNYIVLCVHTLIHFHSLQPSSSVRLPHQLASLLPDFSFLPGYQANTPCTCSTSLSSKYHSPYLELRPISHLRRIYTTNKPLAHNRLCDPLATWAMRSGKLEQASRKCSLSKCQQHRFVR
jgi:hypothetical protein